MYSNIVKYFDIQDVGNSTLNCGLVTGHEPNDLVNGFTGIMELNCVRQGTNSYNRIGSKIFMESIEIKVPVTTTIANSSNSPAVVRYMMVYDRQPNKAFPVLNDIIAVNDGAVSLAAGVKASNMSRFVVLFDEFFILDAAGGIGRFICEFIPINLETVYGSNGGTIADITTGSLLLVAYSNYNAAASFSPINSRLNYTD